MRISIFFTALLAAFCTTVLPAEIVVGQVAPLSGLDANLGQAYAKGMQLLFAKINSAGGINRHTFTLVSRDDKGKPLDTLAATRALLSERSPIVLAGYFGTRNITDLVASGLLEKERIALVGYRTTEVREETPHLYSVRANLRDEFNKVTQHLATIGITRLGLLYEEGVGSGSSSVLTAIDEAAKKSRIIVVAKAGYPAGTAEVAQAVTTLVAAAPQAIIMVSSGTAVARFIEQYRTLGGAAQLFAHSGVDIEELSKQLDGKLMHGIAIAQVAPNPYRIGGRLAKEFSDMVAVSKDFDGAVSYAMIEGFIAAKIIAEAVRRQGANPSRTGTIDTLDSMDRFDLGDYAVAFRPGMRGGSRYVELSIVSSTRKIRQ
jgi:branched-chain amino acid transport system substrate-binding protein